MKWHHDIAMVSRLGFQGQMYIHVSTRTSSTHIHTYIRTYVHSMYMSYQIPQAYLGHDLTETHRLQGLSSAVVQQEHGGIAVGGRYLVKICLPSEIFAAMSTPTRSMQIL
jgi:hypothetical protein